ncbi:MAG: class I SAM-dependent methyltransferase [Candidatus Hodarchaeota archaeon]
MSNDVLFDINLDHFRKNFIKYTIKAFQMLPKLDKPRILDIGCGSGVQTIELAKLSNSEIIGIDIDQSLLDKLNKKIEEEDFSNRIKVLNCSLFNMEFPDESFDIIWAEGSIWIIGFTKALMEWKRLLKPKGFLVVHDDITKVKSRLKKVPSCGYKLFNHFLLPDDAWWEEYYGPLEIRIKKLYNKYENDPEALKILNKQQKEINMVKAEPKNFRSAFYIVQKIE